MWVCTLHRQCRLTYIQGCIYIYIYIYRVYIYYIYIYISHKNYEKVDTLEHTCSSQSGKCLSNHSSPLNWAINSGSVSSLAPVDSTGVGAGDDGSGITTTVLDNGRCTTGRTTVGGVGGGAADTCFTIGLRGFISVLGAELFLTETTSSSGSSSCGYIFLLNWTSIITKIKLYLNTLKSGTAAPFTGG